MSRTKTYRTSTNLLLGPDHDSDDDPDDGSDDNSEGKKDDPGDDPDL